MNVKLSKLVIAALASTSLMGFGGLAHADSTDDIVNALVMKGVLTEEEGALLTKGHSGESAAAKKEKEEDHRMIFKVKPVMKIGHDDDLYEAVSLLSKYFADNPDEPYVELICDLDGVKEVVGRINNPQFTELIHAVRYGLDRIKRDKAVRTVLTRGSTNEKWPETD